MGGVYLKCHSIIEWKSVLNVLIIRGALFDVLLISKYLLKREEKKNATKDRLGRVGTTTAVFLRHCQENPQLKTRKRSAKTETACLLGFKLKHWTEIPWRIVQMDLTFRSVSCHHLKKKRMFAFSQLSSWCQFPMYAFHADCMFSP